MAELYVARLPGVEGFAKQVALKRVLPGLANNREFVEMFLEEARLAATLQHQNVVQVHDIGQDADGYFFAMEYLHGADVGEILRTVDGIPLPIALEIARGACAGLHYAHERKNADGALLGIVHRDVSPQNLFVTFDGGVKLLDFGIAKAVQQTTKNYTRSGTVRGKLPYMSPEQCQSEPIDRRSDVFSLAVVIWEMTVGERLFGANRESDFEILKAIVDRDAPRPSTRKPDYPAALEAIVMKGLARDKGQRYPTADEMQGELEGFMRSHNAWASARDVAKFMESQLPDRAAASLELRAVHDEPAAPDSNRPTRVVTPPKTERETVDLPRPDAVRVTPPPADTANRTTATNTTPNPTSRSRSAPLVAAGVGLVVIALVLGMCIGGKKSQSGAAARQGSGSGVTITSTGSGQTTNGQMAELGQGALEPSGRGYVPFRIDTPKAGSYYGNGLYTIELFAKKPPGTCSAATQLSLHVLDADDAIVNAMAIGDSFSVGTWSETAWQKNAGHFDFPPGAYKIELTTTSSCGAIYKVRLVRKVTPS